jgi:fucose permease
VLAALLITIMSLESLPLLWIGIPLPTLTRLFVHELIQCLLISCQSGTVMSGAFMSSVFPTMMTLAEHYLGSLSGRVASLFVIGASAGEMIMPVVVALLFEKYGLWTLFYALFANAGISVIHYLYYPFSILHTFSHHLELTNLCTAP